MILLIVICVVLLVAALIDAQRAQVLEDTIREHKAAKLGSQVFPLPSDIELWEVLDGD